MRKYQVVRASTKPIKGVDAAGQTFQFGTQGAFNVTDPAVAQEIEDRHGKGAADVVVIPHEHREPGHRYFFTVPEMPWKRKAKQ